jgi:hypothetical protein
LLLGKEVSRPTRVLNRLGKDDIVVGQIHPTFRIADDSTAGRQRIAGERLKTYCQQRGIRFMGDVSIYVAHDSADVWAHPDLFPSWLPLSPFASKTLVGERV